MWFAMWFAMGSAFKPTTVLRVGVASAIFFGPFLMQSSVAGESAMTPIPSQLYERPQRLIAVDGPRRLNLYCLGSGSPIVMLDSGTGGGTRDWRYVQAAIASRTTVCAYDRAGYGFSDVPMRPSDATLEHQSSTCLDNPPIPIQFAPDA